MVDHNFKGSTSKTRKNNGRSHIRLVATYSTYFYHEKFHFSWLLFLLMMKFGTMLPSGRKMTPNITPA